MSSLKNFAFAFGLVGAGYVFGTLAPMLSLQAQEESPLPTEDAKKKIADANQALKGAVDALKLESRYESASKTLNSYAVLAGGINVKDDLEGGNGVDPETYAVLSVAAFDKKYNQPNDTLADWVDKTSLGFDAQGRLTYNDKVVRIYSVSKLKKLQARRLVLTNEVKE